LIDTLNPSRDANIYTVRHQELHLRSDSPSLALITGTFQASCRSCEIRLKFHHDIRVRFADTDLQAIVLQRPNYLTYYDVAWTSTSTVGFEWKDLIALGVDTVLAARPWNSNRRAPLRLRSSKFTLECQRLERPA